MIALRWFLGVSAGLAGAGLIAIWTIGSGFRRSFGASAVAPLKALIPLAVLVLITASVAAPQNRLLLHVTAAVAAVAVAGCLWVVRESPGTAVTGLIWLALWFVFYFSAIRTPA